MGDFSPGGDGFKDGGWIQDDHQNQNGEVRNSQFF